MKPDVRAKVLERDRYTCRGCGLSTLPPQIHHILFRSQLGADEVDNLISLCRNCHFGWGHGQGKKQVPRMVWYQMITEDMYGVTRAMAIMTSAQCCVMCRNRSEDGQCLVWDQFVEPLGTCIRFGELL